MANYKLKTQMNEKKKETTKILPVCIDLEISILGAVLLELHAQNIFLKISNPKFFYQPEHTIIAQAIFDLVKKEKIQADIVSITDYLQRNKKLVDVGGAYYITQLTNRVSSTTNIEYWCRIVQEYWMCRNVITICHNSSNKAFDPRSNDIFNVIDETIEQLKSTLPAIEEKKTLSKSLGSVFANILAKNTGQIKTFYNTTSPLFDDLVGFSSGIKMIVGASGIGKTTFTTFLMKNLLKINHEDVSIMWVTIDHEDAGSTIRKFISNELRIDDREIQGKKKKLDMDMLQMIEGLQSEFMKYDILFEEEQMFIDEIRDKFVEFCLKRKDRFNILILDNIMKLRDYEHTKRGNTTEIENHIASVLSNTFNLTRKYNSEIIFLHHFTKEQTDLTNAKEGYRPRLEHVKGSGNLQQIAEQIIMFNRPGKYPDILIKYPEYKEILKHLFIVQVEKNTFGEEGIIYYFSNLKYNDFIEVKCINDYIRTNT